MDHDIKKFAQEIEALQYDLNKIAGSAEWRELLKIIKFPGYTTPSEFFLVSHMVASMKAQVAVLARQQHTLLEGSRLIVEKTAQNKF